MYKAYCMGYSKYKTGNAAPDLYLFGKRLVNK